MEAKIMASPDLRNQVTSRVLKPNHYYIPDYIMNQVMNVIRKSNKRDMGTRHINTKNYYQDGNRGEILAIHYTQWDAWNNRYNVVGVDYITSDTPVSEIQDIVMRIDMWTMRRMKNA